MPYSDSILLASELVASSTWVSPPTPTPQINKAGRDKAVSTRSRGKGVILERYTQGASNASGRFFNYLAKRENLTQVDSGYMRCLTLISIIYKYV